MRKFNLCGKEGPSGFLAFAKLIVKNEDGTIEEIYEGEYNPPAYRKVYDVGQQQKIDYCNKLLADANHSLLTEDEISFLLNPFTGKHTEADSPDELQKLSGFIVEKEITVFDDLHHEQKEAVPTVHKEPFVAETAEETIARSALQEMIDLRDSYEYDDKALIDPILAESIKTQEALIEEKFNYRKFEVTRGWQGRVRILQDNKEISVIDTQIANGYDWERFAKIYLVNTELEKLGQPKMTQKDIDWLCRNPLNEEELAKETPEYLQRLAGFSVKKAYKLIVDANESTEDNSEDDDVDLEGRLIGLETELAGLKAEFEVIISSEDSLQGE